jgi:hypothetical protein
MSIKCQQKSIQIISLFLHQMAIFSTRAIIFITGMFGICGFIFDMGVWYSECIAGQDSPTWRTEELVIEEGKPEPEILGMGNWVKEVKRASHTEGPNSTVCQEQYVTYHKNDNEAQEICNYKLKSKLIAFLLSFLVGGWGVDRIWLARGNPCWNCMGAGKEGFLGPIREFLFPVGGSLITARHSDFNQLNALLVVV